MPELDPDPAPRDPEGGPSDGEPVPKSYGNMSEHHWTKTRGERNAEALEYYRERSRAPGVAEWDGPRAHYCMSCNGVLPLEYDRREPAQELGHCPHCGAELDRRVRAMFNWVETDQVPDSDLKALWPLLVVALGLVVLVLWLLARWIL